MQIELTDEEQALVDQIELDQTKVRDHEQWKTNSDLAFSLITSLLKRKAVPEHRLRYFTDPVYNRGDHGKSRKDRFLANSKTIDTMFRHNNFLAYIRYFIYGPNLPESLIASFGKAVEACGNVTSGDIDPLRTRARALARQYGLNRADADEFYKLALETMEYFYADSIRDAVKHVK